MIIKLSGSTLIVIREPEDKKYYGVVNAKGESNLLHVIKNKLNSLGFELVKKRMWHDGHLVDECQQYLKTPHQRLKTPHIYIHNNRFAIAGAEEGWNKDGEAHLAVTFDVYEKQPNCIELVKSLLNARS